VNEREYLAATLWTPAEWWRDRDGDWKTAVRIGAPTKAGDVGGREVKTAAAPAKRRRPHRRRARAFATGSVARLLRSRKLTAEERCEIALFHYLKTGEML